MEASDNVHASADLTLSKETRYAVHERLGGPENWFELCETNKVERRVFPLTQACFCLKYKSC